MPRRISTNHQPNEGTPPSTARKRAFGGLCCGKQISEDVPNRSQAAKANAIAQTALHSSGALSGFDNVRGVSPTQTRASKGSLEAQMARVAGKITGLITELGITTSEGNGQQRSIETLSLLRKAFRLPGEEHLGRFSDKLVYDSSHPHLSPADIERYKADPGYIELKDTDIFFELHWMREQALQDSGVSSKRIKFPEPLAVEDLQDSEILQRIETFLDKIASEVVATKQEAFFQMFLFSEDQLQLKMLPDDFEFSNPPTMVKDLDPSSQSAKVTNVQAFRANVQMYFEKNPDGLAKCINKLKTDFLSDMTTLDRTSMSKCDHLIAGLVKKKGRQSLLKNLQFVPHEVLSLPITKIEIDKDSPILFLPLYGFDDSSEKVSIEWCSNFNQSDLGKSLKYLTLRSENYFSLNPYCQLKHLGSFPNLRQLKLRVRQAELDALGRFDCPFLTELDITCNPSVERELRLPTLNFQNLTQFNYIETADKVDHSRRVTIPEGAFSQCQKMKALAFTTTEPYESVEPQMNTSIVFEGTETLKGLASLEMFTMRELLCSYQDSNASEPSPGLPEGAFSNCQSLRCVTFRNSSIPKIPVEFLSGNSGNKDHTLTVEFDGCNLVDAKELDPLARVTRLLLPNNLLLDNTFLEKDGPVEKYFHNKKYRLRELDLSCCSNVTALPQWLTTSTFNDKQLDIGLPWALYKQKASLFQHYQKIVGLEEEGLVFFKQKRDFRTLCKFHARVQDNPKGIRFTLNDQMDSNAKDYSVEESKYYEPNELPE